MSMSSGSGAGRPVDALGHALSQRNQLGVVAPFNQQHNDQRNATEDTKVRLSSRNKALPGNLTIAFTNGPRTLSEKSARCGSPF